MATTASIVSTGGESSGDRDLSAPLTPKTLHHDIDAWRRSVGDDRKRQAEELLKTHRDTLLLPDRDAVASEILGSVDKNGPEAVNFRTERELERAMEPLEAIFLRMQMGNYFPALRSFEATLTSDSIAPVLIAYRAVGAYLKERYREGVREQIAQGSTLVTFPGLNNIEKALEDKLPTMGYPDRSKGETGSAVSIAYLVNKLIKETEPSQVRNWINGFLKQAKQFGVTEKNIIDVYGTILALKKPIGWPSITEFAPDDYVFPEWLDLEKKRFDYDIHAVNAATEPLLAIKAHIDSLPAFADRLSQVDVVPIPTAGIAQDLLVRGEYYKQAEAQAESDKEGMRAIIKGINSNANGGFLVLERLTTLPSRIANYQVPKKVGVFIDNNQLGDDLKSFQDELKKTGIETVLTSEDLKVAARRKTISDQIQQQANSLTQSYIEKINNAWPTSHEYALRALAAHTEPPYDPSRPDELPTHVVVPVKNNGKTEWKKIPLEYLSSKAALTLAKSVRQVIEEIQGFTVNPSSLKSVFEKRRSQSPSEFEQQVAWAIDELNKRADRSPQDSASEVLNTVYKWSLTRLRKNVDEFDGNSVPIKATESIAQVQPGKPGLVAAVLEQRMKDVLDQINKYTSEVY